MSENSGIGSNESTQYGSYDFKFTDLEETSSYDTSTFVSSEVSTDIGLDGVDTTEAANNDPFLSYLQNQGHQNTGEYTSSSSNPTLPTPGQAGPSPAFVTSLKQVFISTAMDQLGSIVPPMSKETSQKIVQYLLDPSTVSLTEGEIQIANEIEPVINSEVQTKVGLSSNWTIQSNPSTWTVAIPEPYGEEERNNIVADYKTQVKTAGSKYVQELLESTPPQLTIEQAADLQIAIDTGKPPSDPEVLTHYTKVQAAVTDFIQNKYGLDTNWSINTNVIDASKWVPVNLSALSPTQLNNIFAGLMLDNLKDLLDNLKQILSNLNTLPAGIQEAIKNASGKMSDFLKEIASALQGLKAQLHQMQVEAAEKRKELSIMQFGETQSKRLVEAARLAATRRQSAKQRLAHAFTKIFAPIISAVALLMTAVSAVATVISGGALSGLLIACIALTVLAFSYSVADAATGGKVTAELTAGLGKALETLTKYLAIAMCFGAEVPDQLKTAVKVFLMAAVVAAAVAAMVVSGNIGSGIQFGSQAAATAFSTMMAAAVSQITLQIMTSVLMSPQGIPAVATEILMQNVKNPTARQKMIAQMVAMAVGMFVIILATSAGMKPNPGGIKEMAKSAADTVKTTIKDLGDDIAQMARSAYQAAKDASVAFKEFVKSGDMLGIMVRSALITSGRGLTAAGRLAMEGLQEFMQLMKDIMTYVPRAASDLMKDPSIMNIAKHINKTGTFLNLTATVIQGTVLGVINLSLAKILKELGELSAAEEMIKGLIKMFEKLMNSINDYMSGTSSDISSIINAVKGLFRKAEATLDKITEAVRPVGA